MQSSQFRDSLLSVAATAFAGVLALGACAAPSVSADVPPVRDVRESMCFVDFPCGTRRFQCVTENTYYNLQSYDCHHQCGPGPCSGGTCEPVGAIQTCAPGGMRCDDSYNFSQEDRRSSPCEARPEAGVGDASAPDVPLTDTADSDI